LTFKIVAVSDNGDSTHHGSDSIDKINKYLAATADPDGDVVDIVTNTTWRNQVPRFRNPANTFAYILNTSAVAADRNITLPLLTADDTFTFITFAQTLKNKTLSDGTKASSDLAINGVLSPAQITANQNDYNPTNLSTANWLRLSTDASRNITSIAGGADGRVLALHNIGSFNIVLKDDDGSTGTAANRFALSSDITLEPDQCIIIHYDNTTQRWRALSTPISHAARHSPSGADPLQKEVISGQTEDTAPDATADYILTYDASATALKKVLLSKVSPVGLHDVWIPAAAFWITTTSGATALAKTETGTNKLNYQSISFASGATNRAETTITMPRNYNNGTVKARVYWLTTSSSTNSVTWFVSGVAFGDNAAIDAAQGTQQSIADANNAASTLNISGQTSAITIAGTPADTKMIQLRVERQSGDTLAAAALFMGVSIEYTTDAAVAG